MKLAVVTSVRNECDIVEAFVRHNLAFCDRLYVVDNRSTDATSTILSRLADEGLPVEVSRDDTAVFYQGRTMTHLVKRAVADRDWDFVLPLDGDEFIGAADRAALEASLSDLDGATVGLTDVVNLIPTAHDDATEKDVPRRIVHRAKMIPDFSCKIGKVSIPGGLVKRPGFSIDEGQHSVCGEGKPVAHRRLDSPPLAHFPIRSADQFILRTILCRLAWHARSDYNPGWGWHYEPFIKTIKTRRAVSADDLTEAALLYVDIYNEPGRTPHRKVLVREPMRPAYDRLRFTDLIDVAVLPPVLDMLDGLLGELSEARGTVIRPSRVRKLVRAAWRACTGYRTRSTAGT